MSFSKKITLAVLACASPFFSGCSDNHKQDLVSDLSDISEDRRLLHIGATNPKTLYIKKHDDIEVFDEGLIIHQEVKGTLKDLQPNDIKQNITFKKQEITPSVDSENLAKISSLSLIIDKLNLEVKDLKVLDDNNSKLLSNKELQLQDLLKEKDSLKKEIEDLTLNLKNSEELLLSKKEETVKLINSRDESLKVFDDLNLTVKTLKSKHLEIVDQLNEEITTLKSEVATKQKLVDETKEMLSQKIKEFDLVKKERDDAIKITLDLNKSNQEKEDERVNLTTKVQSLMQVNTQKDTNLSSININLEKAKNLIIVRDKELSKAIASNDEVSKLYDETKELLNKKDTEIQKLLQERDDAIKTTLALNERNVELNSTISSLMDDLNKKQKAVNSTDDIKNSIKELESKNIELHRNIERLTKQNNKDKLISNEKIATITVALLAAKELTVKSDTEVKQLGVKLTDMEKQLENEVAIRNDIEEKILKERKDSVINSILSTFSLSKVEFKSGSSILLNSSKKLLDRVSKIMLDHPEYKYNIQGHTDSSGKEELNLKLSEKRANSVKDYLVSKGLSDSMLSFKGYGSSKPIADNKTSKGRSANRRVVFEIIN